METTKNKIIKSKKIAFCPGHDRLILIIKENGKIVGLNYCQGDDLDYFTENFDYIDYDLTDFYHSVKEYIISENKLEQINSIIWAYFQYKNAKHLRKYGFNRPRSN
jgi:hypothetical protein